MITGKSGGSGKFSCRSRSSGRKSVTVSHMPEDGLNIRISFSEDDEKSIPILKISDTYAEMLWAALNEMASDLKWEDFK